MTALHHAARFGHKNIVKFLIDNGKSNNGARRLQYSIVNTDGNRDDGYDNDNSNR